MHQSLDEGSRAQCQVSPPGAVNARLDPNYSSVPDPEPRPFVDIRIVLVTVAGGQLLVSLEDALPSLRLHRGQPHPNVPLDPEARRVLRESTGRREEYLEQLYTLSGAGDRGWEIVVAYLGLVATVSGTLPALGGSWHDVRALPSLESPDRMVIDYAVQRLRAKIGYTTIAFHLLPPTFTLSELQGAYESILDQSLDKRNFRRRVLAADFLTPTAEKRRVGSHRPALLYRFRDAHDRETYLTPGWVEGV